MHYRGASMREGGERNVFDMVGWGGRGAPWPPYIGHMILTCIEGKWGGCAIAPSLQLICLKTSKNWFITIVKCACQKQLMRV